MTNPLEKDVQPKRAKYRAIPTDCGAGHRHPSKIEAGRCDQLHAQQVAGVIADLSREPEFPIVINGKRICVYRADFAYQMADSGLAVVEDVKGKPTPVFNLKRKLVEAAYPGIVIAIWPVKKRKARKVKRS